MGFGLPFPFLARQMTPLTQSLVEGSPEGGLRRCECEERIQDSGQPVRISVVVVVVGINLTLSSPRVAVSGMHSVSVCWGYSVCVFRRMCAEIYNWKRHLKHIRMEIADFLRPPHIFTLIDVSAQNRRR